MSTNYKKQTVYGLNQGLLQNPPAPIIAQRAPTNFDKAQYGTVWIDQSANLSYILTTIEDNIAHWEEVGSGGGVNTVNANTGSAVGSGGAMSFVGGSNITTSAASSTVTITLGSTLSVANTITAGTGLTATTGDVTATAGNLVLPATGTSTAGAIMAGSLPLLHQTGTQNLFTGTHNAPFTLTGSNNAGFGQFGFEALTTGSRNSLLGNQCLNGITTGNSNLALGYNSGSSYTNGTESSNIMVANIGVLGESNVLRIGTQGTGDGQQDTCYIAGITGATVTGSSVLCSTSGQLGTISSSVKFKENIKDIAGKSKDIYNLRPVYFNYKKDESKMTHYGLIAEEVKNVFKDLVLYDAAGQPSSVAYHELPVLLLNEIKNLREELDQVKKKLSTK